jgi:hypothetical protein
LASAARGQVVVKWIAGTALPIIALSGSDQFNKTAGGSSGTLKLVNHASTYDSDGTSIWTVRESLPLSGLDLRFAPITRLPAAIFGDGSDGAVTISSNTSLTRDMYYSSLTVNAGVTLSPNGWRIFCTGTANILGTIDASGGNGTASAGASGGGPGAAGGGANAVIAQGAAGTTGGITAGTVGNAGGPYLVDPSVNSGAGGASGGGNAGGGAGAQSRMVGGVAQFRNSANAILAEGITSGIVIGRLGGGASGGSGAGDGTNRGGGGGGGASGIVIVAAVLAGNGTIAAKGGNGGGPGTTGNCGGGGGGNGGSIILVTTSNTFTGTITAAGGTGGAGVGTGVAGGAGAPGGTLTLLVTV